MIPIDVSFHCCYEQIGLIWASAGASQLSRHQVELVELTAAEAVRRLCSGSLSASEYAEALLAQNELHACLNNFAALEPQRVRHVLRGRTS